MTGALSANDEKKLSFEGTAGQSCRKHDVREEYVISVWISLQIGAMAIIGTHSINATRKVITFIILNMSESRAYANYSRSKKKWVCTIE